MKVLLRNHGVSLSGVKSDLYTAIGPSFVIQFFFVSVMQTHFLSRY